MTPLLVYYLLAVNLATFIAYGIDKLKARHNGGRGSRQQTRRIPEASLLLLAALGSCRFATISSAPDKRVFRCCRKTMA
jgi:uncharacterized membrane protein YsdA (DUF1294 family)